jgi:integrase/recombinase XerC
MRLRECTEDFLRHLQYERNLSSHTTSQYARDLRDWLQHLEQHEVSLDTDAITVQVMRRWLQEMAESGRRPPTVTRKLCCLRSFWKFARRYHDIEHDPMSPLITPKQDRKLPETLKRSEVMRLFQACDQSHYQFHRIGDRAIVAVLACLGLRRQELIDARVEDFDPENRTLLVRSAKRGRERLVPLTDDLVALITQWLPVRSAFDDPHLFVTRHGTPLTPKRLEDMLGRLGRQAGFERRPCLHMFRHYAGTSMVQQGGIERARRLLGHQSPETTAIYSHLSVDDLRSAVDETAVQSGMARGNSAARPDIQVDPGTEMALYRLERAVGGLPDGWRRRDTVLRDLVSHWTAEVASGRDEAFTIDAVNEILWSRATVPGLSFDDHVVIANFGNAAGRHLTACDGRPPDAGVLVAIGGELAHGLRTTELIGEGVTDEQIARAVEGLTDPGTEGGVLGTLARVAGLCASLQPYRVDIPHGRQAIELLVGLTTWSRGLPPLIVPASERRLWGLLVGRFLVGDGLPVVAYATAKLQGLMERIDAILQSR